MGHVRCPVGIWPSRQRNDTVKAWAFLDVQRDTSPPSAPLLFFPFLMLLSWRVVRICSVVCFLEHFGDCEMEWTQESVIKFIEIYERKEIIWDPKHTMHFNKIRKQDAREELGKEMNRPVDECVSARLSWTEMAFLKAVSFLEIFSPIKLIKNSNSLWDILVRFLYNPLTDWKFSLPANSNRCTLPCCVQLPLPPPALFSFPLKRNVYKCTKPLLTAKTSPGLP